MPTQLVHGQPSLDAASKCKSAWNGEITIITPRAIVECSLEKGPWNTADHGPASQS